VDEIVQEPRSINSIHHHDPSSAVHSLGTNTLLPYFPFGMVVEAA